MSKLNLFIYIFLLAAGVPMFCGAQNMQNRDGNWYADYVGSRVLVTQPASVSGSYNYTVANTPTSTTGWGATIQSVNISNVDVIKADPYEACINPLTNASALSGKIALIKRGNCEFGEKALHAQNAGAVAVVIVNNVAGGPVGMGAGAQGANVTIPVLMISDVDGAAIEAELNNSVQVKMSFTAWGNGFNDDLAIVESGLSLWHANAIPFKQLSAGTSTAYKGMDGAVIANFGSNTATNVKLKSTLSWTPTGGSKSVVRTDSVVVAGSFSASDSIITPFIDNLYDLNPTSTGTYEIMYEVSSDQTDQLPGDNVKTYEFHVTDRVFSKARYDLVDNEPFGTVGFRRQDGNAFMWGPLMYAKKAGYELDGMQFAISTTNRDLSTFGQSVFGLVYKWVDGTGGQSNNGLMEAGELELVAGGAVTFSAGDSSGDFFMIDLKDPVNNTPVYTEDDAWYWVAIRVPASGSGNDVFLICDGELNYFVRQWDRAKATNSFYEPFAPIFGGTESDIPQFPTVELVNPFDPSDVDSANFAEQNAGLMPSIALHLSLFPNSVKEVKESSINMNIYPNPVTDVINAEINLTKSANIEYHLVDNLGRISNSGSVKNTQNTTVSISTNELASGTYHLVVVADGDIMYKKVTILK